MTEASKTDKPKSNPALFTVAAFLCVLILVVATLALRDRNISQALFTSVLGLCVALGLISIGGLLEAWIKPALGFEIVRWVFVSGLAFVVYLSRIDAVNDINAIFHIDASALPLTSVAGTVMRFATYMRWPMVIIFAVSLLTMGLMAWGTVLEGKDEMAKIGLGVRVFAALVSSGLAWCLIHFQLNDAGLSAKLYRIAHKSDFVGSFNCKSIDPQIFDVLFIGPEQRRVLAAPKIQGDTNFTDEQEQQPELMRPVSIPNYFSVTDCSPGPPPSAS